MSRTHSSRGAAAAARSGSDLLRGGFRGRFRHPAAVVAAFAVVAAGTPFAAAPASAAAAPASTLVVSADQPFRPVTHVATGSLYGLADDATPSDALVQAIKPNTFVQMAVGGQQQAKGDVLVVADKAARAGAKVVDRLSDYYAGWPYQFSWSTWPSVVEQQVKSMQSAGVKNLAAWELWNESDNTWLAANGTYEDFWTKTFRQVRSLDPTTPIQGPSFSDNIGDMQNFLQNAVDTDTVPDIIAWHELINSGKIVTDVAKVAAIMKDLGISPRPIAIEEYGAPAEVGIPGAMVGYIAKFERYGIHDAELAFWNGYGALGDLLTGTGGNPNGAYWLYKWYADMSGDMVTTTPPNATTGLDGAAAVTTDKKQVQVIFGGGGGATAVRVDGLDKLDLGATVHAKLEYTPSYGRTNPAAGPITISDTVYQVTDGSITVPVATNSVNGYHLVISGAGTATDLQNTYRITNLNSGLALGAQGDGTAGSLVGQVTASGAAAQRWKLLSTGSGLYKVVSAAGGLVLGVKDGASGNGASAIVETDTGDNSQLWQVVPDGKGHHKLVNYDDGYVLGVDGMSKEPGAQVVQWSDSTVTSSGTGGTRVAGKLGKALALSGSNQYVNVPRGAVSGVTGDFTISAWVNPAKNSTWSRLFDFGTGTSKYMFLTVNKGTGLRFAITTGGAGGEQQINSTTTLPLNTWSLVTVTVSGTTGTLYVNGQVAGTSTNLTLRPSDLGATNQNWIGRSQYSGDAYLAAAVDDFNVYGRALTAAEVSALAGGDAGAGDVLRYTFDESSGTAVADSSGNGRNATVVSSPQPATSDAAVPDHFWTLAAYPAITGVSVADGATVSGTRTFTADLGGAASDVSYTYIELNRGGVWLTDNTKAPGSHNDGLHPDLVVDTTAYPNGDYQLKIDVVGTNGLTTEQIVPFVIGNPPAWVGTKVYDTGDQATYHGSVWRALWWTQNQTPGDPYGAWEQMVTTPDGTAVWTPSRIFVSGDRADYQGVVYEAKWWTRDQTPGDPNGPWKRIG
ncbi:RICIN domain-containing protein [Microbispora sp. RL4-1S]|uniref:RICIN domain-containing protein n=1 Tax=Microbispora oryzae TaxID=2806554 RepID=A0A941AKV7_9ACTN|nr:LamG-like jellyroll fold domain-containing protein [Microbispora oryzae]MBP2707890.1 RICIN domain-containing protein [Microbispora oryzae]